jgi:sec1 family domain-containing protein 1
MLLLYTSFNQLKKTLIKSLKFHFHFKRQDCEKNLYENFYLNFVQPSSRDLLELLATKLVENGSTDKISKVYDQFLNFICVETNFFSLDLKELFINV